MPLTHASRCVARKSSSMPTRPLPSPTYTHRCLQNSKNQISFLARSRDPHLHQRPFDGLLKSGHKLPATVNMALTHQSRSHAGHSHSHHHGNAYLTSTNKKDAGVRITRIGLFVNLGMAIGKGAGGYVFHSQALIADAFHALTDLCSDFMTLFSVGWSLRPSTTTFPNGYGKIESLGALGVSGLLLFGGIGMGANALDVLYIQFFADVLQDTHRHGLFSFLGHDHSHGAALPDLNAAWLAGGSIIVKEWLYRASMSKYLLRIS